MPFGIGFWEDFDGFSVPKWSQVASKILLKIDVNLESHFLKKPRFSLGKTMILRVQGVEVGGKNRCKIDKKMESRWEDILGSIFNGFWWIFGGKLGRKIEPRSMKKSNEKR